MLRSLQARESLLFFHRLKASVIVFNLGETTSGTQITCFTGTKVQILTQKLPLVAVGGESLQAMI